MKGTIVKCMEELVKKQFGKEQWDACMQNAGFAREVVVTINSDIPDEEIPKLVKSIAKVTKLSEEKVIEAFGEYWSTTYAPSIYNVYFEKAKSAKELLANLDHIHTAMTKSVKGAKPPHFTYEWEGEKVLLMHYNSHRGMVAYMPALIRGVGKYYKERVNVSVTGNTVRVQFA